MSFVFFSFLVIFLLDCLDFAPTLIAVDGGANNLQDLKTGHILGATPWKQQIMQAIGVLSSSFVMMPVLWMLHRR